MIRPARDQPRLERARLGVEAGVEQGRVRLAGPRADVRTGLQQRHVELVARQLTCDRRADHRRIGRFRDLGGLRRGLDAEPDRDRQVSEPAQPRDCVMYARGLGRARAGDAAA